MKMLFINVPTPKPTSTYMYSDVQDIACCSNKSVESNIASHLYGS